MVRLGRVRAMGAQATVERAFPELADVKDGSLRSGVTEAWAIAVEENGVESLESVPWLPSVQSELGLSDETLVEHTRDVYAAATALGESLLERRGVDLQMDFIRAAGLIHDVSQLAEFDGWDATPVYELIGHPYYAMYVMERAGLPVEVQHAVLAHSPFSNVEPATMEAVVLNRADYAVARSIRWRVFDDLREAP